MAINGPIGSPDHAADGVCTEIWFWWRTGGHNWPNWYNFNSLKNSQFETIVPGLRRGSSRSYKNVRVESMTVVVLSNLPLILPNSGLLGPKRSKRTSFN